MTPFCVEVLLLCSVPKLETEQVVKALGLPESSTQTASRSVQPFWQSSPHSAPGNCSFPLLLHGFLSPTEVLNPHGISIGSTVFAGLGTVTGRHTDRPTDRPRYSVCNNRPHLRRLRSTTMQPNNAVKTYLKHSQKSSPIYRLCRWLKSFHTLYSPNWILDNRLFHKFRNYQQEK